MCNSAPPNDCFYNKVSVRARVKCILLNVSTRILINLIIVYTRGKCITWYNGNDKCAMTNVLIGIYMNGCLLNFCKSLKM